MGYTHYWTNITPNATIAEAARKIIDASPVTICGPSGHGDPEITDTRIALNGDAATDDDFETFAIDADADSSSFCKTGYRPYDEVVAAILIALILDGQKVQSDGISKSQEWQRAIALYEQAVAPLSDADRQHLQAAIG